MLMKKYLLASAFLLVATLVMSFTPAPTGYKAGDLAADFHLKNVDGKMVSPMDNKKAKGYIVVFTCNHCPFSKKYESRILGLDKWFAPKGYPVIAINPNDPATVPDDSYANMVKLAKSHQYTFPYLIDADQSIAHAYGATNTPHVYVVEKEAGKLVVKYVGAIDDNADDEKAATKHYVRDAVNDLLEGKPVGTQQTKAIGCTIKWKNS